MEIKEIIKKRHSVRSYTDKSIEKEKRSALNELASQINNETGLNIQIIYDEPKCFDGFMAHYGKFTGVRNYIALVGKKANDTEEKLGYYGEKIVLKAQELNLNTCWVALTHGKSSAKINKGEKLYCLISLGYGAVQGVEHKNKSCGEVCNYSENLPDWYIEGIDAALLAPTAMNQQKFFIKLKDDGTLIAEKGKGFYTGLDLGIVKYHFEAVTGKKF